MKFLFSLCSLIALLGIIGCSTPATGRTNGTATSQDRPPTAVTICLPVFPFELKKQGISGSAEVEFIIDQEGTVREAHVVRATHEAFGWSSVDCILKWKFRPGIKNGRPTAARLRLPFYFSIDEKKQD